MRAGALFFCPCSTITLTCIEVSNNFQGDEFIMKMRPITKAMLLVFPSGLAIGTANIAGAQEAQPPAKPATEQSAKAATQVIDRVVVTATKRETTVQDVPFSINAQTEEDIRRSGAVTLEDLSRNVAGLAIQNLGPGQSQVSIRGVSSGRSFVTSPASRSRWASISTKRRFRCRCSRPTSICST